MDRPTKYIEDALERVASLLDKHKNGGWCQCGHFESCESCNSYSMLNKFRNDLDVALYGDKPKTTLEDYGRSITITL